MRTKINIVRVPLKIYKLINFPARNPVYTLNLNFWCKRNIALSLMVKTDNINISKIDRDIVYKNFYKFKFLKILVSII